MICLPVCTLGWQQFFSETQSTVAQLIDSLNDAEIDNNSAAIVGMTNELKLFLY